MWRTDTQTHRLTFGLLGPKISEVRSDQFFVYKKSDSGCAGFQFQSAVQNMLQSVQNQVKCCYNLEITTSSEGSECLIQFYLCLMSGSHCFIATALQCARTKNRLENEGFRERFRKQKQINNVPLKLTKYKIKHYWIFSVNITVLLETTFVSSWEHFFLHHQPYYCLI